MTKLKFVLFWMNPIEPKNCGLSLMSNMATYKIKKYDFGNTNVFSSQEVRDTREIAHSEWNSISHSIWEDLGQCSHYSHYAMG